jgi:hypothetical protein
MLIDEVNGRVRRRRFHAPHLGRRREDPALRHDPDPRVQYIYVRGSSLLMKGRRF